MRLRNMITAVKKSVARLRSGSGVLHHIVPHYPDRGTDRFKLSGPQRGTTVEVLPMSIQEPQRESQERDYPVEDESPGVDTRDYSREAVTFYEVGNSGAWVEVDEESTVHVQDMR